MSEQQDWQLRMKQEKQRKIAAYREKNQTVLPGQVLFAGSSLMEMFPIEDFIQAYGLPFRVYNRGIGGFVIPQLEEALQDCVLNLRPRRLFINIGTNDLTNASLTEQDVVDTYEALLARIENALPGIEIFTMAYYPINAEAAPDENMRRALRIRNNDRINRANMLVRQMAERRGYRYIDVNDALKDEQGRLRAEYTIQGMHLRAEGYRAIMPALLPYIVGPYKE